jgi:hypothetical protein
MAAAVPLLCDPPNVVTMTQAQLIQQLQHRHEAFAAALAALSDADFEYAAPNKWTAGQQLDHICRSVRPLAWGLMLPRWGIRWLYGSANRPSRTYDALVSKYQQKLAEGGRASGAFLPQPIPVSKRTALSQRLIGLVKRLCRNLTRFDENALDTLVIPHPLLGKLTLREMMYFSIYHVQHHQALMEEYLKQRRTV